MTHAIWNTHSTVAQPKAVLARATIVAVVLGTGLTVANQSDAIFGRAELQLLPLILAYLTPFLVVSVSQVMGTQAAASATGWQAEKHERFLMTLLSHGIIRRALALGIVIGCFNIGLVIADGVIAERQMDQLPVALILQTITLPVLFGALSQSLSFRRAIRTTQPNHESSLL